MPLGDLLAKLLARKEASLPGEQTTALNASYSDRHFTITGLSTDISVLGQIAKTNGVWEPHIMNVMARIVHPDHVCLDIGANIGALTLVLADLARKGVVHSFEPSSINSRFLALNIRRNGRRNAHAHAIGLGAAPGRALFTNLVGMEGCSFVNPPGQPVETIVASAWGSGIEQKSEEVTIDTLDNWMARTKLRRVDFVKMDVEGFELSVLDGGRDTFARHRPKMIIELNRNTLRLYFGIEPRALFDRLAEYYDFIYLIGEDVNQPPRRVASFGEIAPLLELPNHWWVDLLCQRETL
jgi:FkbM family methyltransferase